MAQENKQSGWNVVRKIGEGSSGIVYEINRTLPDGSVETSALKTVIVPRDPQETEELLKQTDIQTIAARYRSRVDNLTAVYERLQELNGNPNVVSVQEPRSRQHADGLGWDVLIRMDLLTPLQEGMPDPCSEEDVFRLGIDLCNALQDSHSWGVVHGDIKPENVFIGKEGQFCLSDFAMDTVNPPKQMTVGAAAFLSPETVMQGTRGAAEDVYSLGMVMYWLLNNRTLPFLPFGAATGAQKQAAITRRLSGEALPDPASGSPELKRIVRKACAFAPEQRYRSARELGSALQVCLNSRNAYGEDDLVDSILYPVQPEPAAPAYIPEPGYVPEVDYDPIPESDPEPEIAAPVTWHSGETRKPKKATKTAKSSRPSKTGKTPKAFRSEYHMSDVDLPEEEDDGMVPKRYVIALLIAAIVLAGGLAVFLGMRLISDRREANSASEEQPVFICYRNPLGISISGVQAENLRELVIPSEIYGERVTEIAARAFAGCDRLERVEFPATITSIGEGAFRDTALKKVDIPTGCALGANAFPADCAVYENGIPVDTSVEDTIPTQPTEEQTEPETFEATTAPTTEPTTAPTTAPVEQFIGKDVNIRGRVTATELFVRSGPATSYDRVDTLLSGTVVNVTKTVENGGTTWGQISKGWISMSYVQEIKEGEEEGTAVEPYDGVVKISSGELIVRQGAGTGYPEVSRLKNGDKVTVTKEQSIGSVKWGYIGKGWVSLDYVEKTGTDSTGSETGGAVSNADIQKFVGDWGDSASQRCMMTVSASGNNLVFEISWANSASNGMEWRFTGTYDAASDTVRYQNGQCREWQTANDGSIERTMLYTNGTGYFHLSGGKLYWVDYTEHAGDNCVFVKTTLAG